MAQRSAMFVQSFFPRNYQSLHLPSSIYEKIKDHFRGIAKLRRCGTNHVWDVQVAQSTDADGKRIFIFTEGWTTIVSDNDVVHNDHIVFDHYGNFTFTFEVYDSETECQRPFHSRECIPWEPVDNNTPQKRPQWTTTGEKGRRASLFLANSVVPNFMIELCSRSLSTGVMNIPWSFTCRFLTEVNEDVEATVVINSYQIRRTVKKFKISSNDSSTCKMYTGTLHFMQLSKLADGDVCAFELVGVSPLKFEVTVF